MADTLRNQDSPSGTSPWSFRIATVAGIPIRLHFTFILFLVWVALSGRPGQSIWPLLVVSIFFCVILHELGHALVARRYGIVTRDITLYPIGGVAMITSRPTPRQELWIALAGPAVNLAIAAILFPIVSATQGSAVSLSLLMDGTFLRNLLTANLVLAIFNLIPAFPMDGGRVLRAALALITTENRATQIAAAIGQILAFGLGLLGLFTGQVVLMLVAFFVFLGAAQEAQASQTRSFLEGHKVADAMQSRFQTIRHGDTFETAAEILLAGSQHDFPVVSGDEILGILTRADLARGLAQSGATAFVASEMRRNYRTATPTEPLESVTESFSEGDSTPILVMDQDRLVGMLTAENLAEFIMLAHARAHQTR